jgi:hypothetical protein
VFRRSRNPVVFWTAVRIATAACKDNRPLPAWINRELFTAAEQLVYLKEDWDKGEEVAGHVSAALGFTTSNKTAFSDYFELLRKMDIMIQYDWLRITGVKELSAVEEIASRSKISSRQVHRIVSAMKEFWKKAG